MYVPPSRNSSPVLSFSAGAAFDTAAGGGDGVFVFFFAGVFASTFADAAWTVGYPDEDAASDFAAAFAGGGDGGFAGFGAGDFAGGGGGVGWVFAARRRLFASTCSRLSGVFFILGAGGGLVAPLADSMLLDLAFDFALYFSAGTDDALAISHGFLCGLTGISGCVGSSNGVGCDGSISGGGSGGDGSFADAMFRCAADMLRNNFPSCL